MAGLAVLALSACGDGGSSPAPAATSGSPTRDIAARIATLTEGERAGVLFRAIRDAGRDCQGVIAATPAGTVEGAPAWLATCDGGERWIVSLRADGTAGVTDPRRVRGG